MLTRNGINLDTIAELPTSSDSRTKVTFANHTYIKKDTRVGSKINFDFLINGEDVIAEAGTRPRFNKIKSFTTAGSHTLELRGNDIYCDNVLLRANTKTLIVETMGGGGGGTGGWAFNNGSGGGAGGYACLLLDMIKYPKVNITIGAGGNGVRGKQGSQANDGAVTTVTSSSGFIICKSLSGAGAHGDSGATGRTSELGAGVIGFTFSGFSGAMEEQDSHIDPANITGITPFNEPNISYPSRVAHGKGNNHGGAGGCSVLAKGGDGGGRKGNGQNGTLGSGGGGGGVGGSTGGRGGDGVLNIYY